MPVGKKNEVCFISAGEHSGDLLGADLVLALKEKFPRMRPYGITGNAMNNAGVSPLASIDDFCVMGITEVVNKIPDLKMIETNILAELDKLKPKFAILIDNAGFHLHLAEQLKLRGIEVIQYIAPKVWAWGENRVKPIKENIDLVLGILPFEEEFFVKNGVNYKYVGSPLKDRTEKVVIERHTLGLPIDCRLIACLPGSRMAEAKKILPILMGLKDIIHRKIPDSKFVVPVAKNLSIEEIFDIVQASDKERKIIQPGNPKSQLAVPHYCVNNIIFVSGMSLEIMRASNAAIVASGTATLECALLQTPMVVVYSMNELSYQIAKSKVKVPYASLVNLIADKKLVNEYLQDFSLSDIADDICSLIEDKERRTSILHAFEDLRDHLKSNAAFNAAKEIHDHINPGVE